MGKFKIGPYKKLEDVKFDAEEIVCEDGTIKVKNELGEYVDSAYVTFYNTKEKKQEVVVPPTSSNKTLLIVSGIALLIGGVYYAKKTIKEC